MIKKVTSFMLLFMVIFTVPSFLSTGVDYNSEADTLKAYGLFSGTDNGYELERVPSRVEAAAMLVKLLGKEEEAKSNHYSHPFKDIPTWANDVIGFMYENKMTSGVSEDMFGSKQSMKSKDFTVFALKALGYSGSDFDYSDTMAYAEKVGLFDAKTLKDLQSVEFKRDEMVHISFRAIGTKVKDSDQTLFDKLKAEGMIKKVSDSTLSTTEAFLAGKTNRYEKTIKNINTSGNQLKINTDVVNFEFTKKEDILTIEDYAEPVVVSENPLVTKSQNIVKGVYLDGDRKFPKTFAQWGDSVIYYNLALYKNGVYKMSADFASVTTQGFATNFYLPTIDFDEIRMSAYPVDDRFFGTTPDDFVKIIKSSDVSSIMQLVSSGTAISRTGSNIGTADYSSVESFKRFLMTYYYGGEHYPNGDFTKTNANKVNLPNSSLPYEVKFVSTGFPYPYKIVKDKAGNATRVTYTFVTSKIENENNFYFIYDEGFKIKNIMIITN